MPNRILKESVCLSEQVDSLTWFEEVVFYRLIVNCDDYGRFDGRISVIKSRLFALKENLTHKQISDAIGKLASVGLVALYEYEGKPFLYLPTWNEHQNVRAKKSKYPEPGKQAESICIQMNTNAFKCSRNPIQSESNPIREFNADILSEAAVADIGPTEPAVVDLILNDKSLYPVTQSQIDHWSELYPAVDIKQELLKMKGWLESNPNRRKTKRGINAFITSWLAREQDRGHKPSGTNSRQEIPTASKEGSENPFVQWIERNGDVQ